MKKSPYSIATLALIALVSLSACSLSAFTGIRYQITSNPAQQSITFDCQIATSTGQCHLATAQSSYTIAVTKSLTVTNLPLGSFYCVAEQAIVRADCTKASVVNGTTNVESGRSARGSVDSHTLQSGEIGRFFGFH
jgi:hypothetical protein